MNTFAGGAPECTGTAELLAERRIWGGENSTLLPEHAGVWAGELSGVAASEFPGTGVELELRADATGSFRIDGVEPPEPSASAETGYLCDGSVSGGICGSISGFVAGFDYPTERAMSRGDVLSFSLVGADPWGGWCSLQEPIARPEPFIACGVAFDALPPGSERWSAAGCELALETGSEAIECGRMYSLERCACARDGCIASFATWMDVGLRLSADATELSGSLWFENETDAATLRLRRQ